MCKKNSTVPVNGRSTTNVISLYFLHSFKCGVELSGKEMSQNQEYLPRREVKGKVHENREEISG